MNKFVKVNLLVAIGIKLLKCVRNQGGVHLLAHNLEQRTQLGDTDGSIAIAVKGIKALLERGDFVLGEGGGGGGLYSEEGGERVEESR